MEFPSMKEVSEQEFDRADKVYREEIREFLSELPAGVPLTLGMAVYILRKLSKQEALVDDGK